jgi:hypothetical protein
MIEENTKTKPKPRRKPRKRKPTTASKRVATRKVVNNTVKVHIAKSKDLSTYFRLHNNHSNTPDRKISTVTIIDTEDVEEGESYIIFKKRANGTWELIITKDLEHQIDELKSIAILHDRKLSDL